MNNQFRYKVKGINIKWAKTKQGLPILNIDIWINAFLRFISDDTYGNGVLPCIMKKKTGENFFTDHHWTLHLNPRQAEYWDNNKIPEFPKTEEKYKRTLVKGMIGRTFGHPFEGGNLCPIIFIDQLKEFLLENKGYKGKLPLVVSFGDDGKVSFFVNNKKLEYLKTLKPGMTTHVSKKQESK